MQPWALSLPDKELCLREAEPLQPRQPACGSQGRDQRGAAGSAQGVPAESPIRATASHYRPREGGGDGEGSGEGEGAARVLQPLTRESVITSHFQNYDNISSVLLGLIF